MKESKDFYFISFGSNKFVALQKKKHLNFPSFFGISTLEFVVIIIFAKIKISSRRLQIMKKLGVSQSVMLDWQIDPKIDVPIYKKKWTILESREMSFSEKKCRLQTNRERE